MHAARQLQPQIRAQAAQIEADGRLPRGLVEALTERGLFRMNIPAEANGGQAHPLVVFHAIEALAAADASTAWVVMIASEVSLLTGWLPAALLSQMIGGDEAGGPRCRIVGSSRLLASGRRTLSGWRLSGRLNFVSGVEHASYVLVTFRAGQDGAVRMALLPQRAGKVLQTWDTMGLRGTGSHDWLIEDAYVQDAHTWLPADGPCAAGPAWRAPDRSVVAWIANAGHALGAAQGAIDELVEASGAAASSGDARRLAEREAFRIAVARAQARVSAARRVRAGGGRRSLAGIARRLARPRPAGALAARQRARGARGRRRCRTDLPRGRDQRRAPPLDARTPLPRPASRAPARAAGLEWNWDAGVRPGFGLEERRSRQG